MDTDFHRWAQMVWAQITRIDSATVLGGPPFGVSSNHGIDDGEESSHAGNKRDLLRFASGDKALIVGPDQRVAARRAEGGHEEHGPEVSPATPNGPFTPVQAAIPIERRDAGESGD